MKLQNSRPTRSWLDERREKAILRLLGAEGVDADALFAPPPAEGDDARGFCPRCHAQYVALRERCAGCPEIRVPPLR